MPKFSEEEKKKKYLSLLANGENLFNKKGFYEVTAEEIALSSGIAKGTFYHFFENKEHLFMVINNRLQENIFSNVKQKMQQTDQATQVEKFNRLLNYVMDEFIRHPMIMEVDEKVWSRIEEKAPRDCILENNQRDLKLIQLFEQSGFIFRYDIETITELLQYQFISLAYIYKNSQNDKLIRIFLRSLSEHILREEKL